ncbi:unnamed protein product, partial [Nesidiocoris tenuis]
RPSPGTLPLFPSALFEERASLPGDVYASRDAGNEGVRRPRSDQRLHHHPLDGYEIRPLTPRIKSTTPYPIASGRGKQMHCCDWSRCHRRITQLISLTFLGQFPLFIPSSANGTWAFLDRNSKEHRGTNFCTGTRCEKPKASIG